VAIRRSVVAVIQAAVNSTSSLCPCARQLGFDLPGEVGQIGDEIDRGVPVDVVCLGKPLELGTLLVELR